MFLDPLLAFWLCEQYLRLFVLWRRGSSSDLAQSSGVGARTTSMAGNVAGSGVTNILWSSLLSASGNGVVCRLSVAISV